MNYWEECIAVACEEAGVAVTDRQVQVLAGSVEAAHENYGMAFGHDAIPSPYKSELDAVRNELALERSKVLCASCGGVGWIAGRGPIHCSFSQCYVCRGDGRVAPS